ncbi:hypothetical protein NC652_004790 [Populus alba x Populus x berolinensis]|nr:hypothetical protein NC652_004790 [Populus alba x Populus x berolinensis]
MSSNKGKDVSGRFFKSCCYGSRHQHNPPPLTSINESQKRRDWKTTHLWSVLGGTRDPQLHYQQCNAKIPEPPGPCTCPLKQAWGSLECTHSAGLRAAYEENGGLPVGQTILFASGCY